MRESKLGLLSRLVNRPLLSTPDMARFYFGYLAQRHDLAGVLIDGATGAETPFAELTALGRYDYSEGRAVPTVPGSGMAVIEISGSLAHKYGHLEPSSGMTGYDGIEAKLEMALADPAITGIMLDIHSHGGEASGCFDLADKIRAANAVKPVWAVADEVAYSAAYALASSASRLTTPRSGMVGSVGVVYMHVDWSKALEKDGIAVTLIFAGAHKVDGNPYEPLPPAVRNEVAAEAEGLRRIFGNIVAAGNGLSLEDVLATEARCLTADAALDAGFVDAVQPAADTFGEFAEFLAGAGGSAPVPAATAATQATQEDSMAKRKGAAARAAQPNRPKPSPAAKAEDQTETDPGEEEEEEGAAESGKTASPAEAGDAAADEEEPGDSSDDDTPEEDDEEEASASAARTKERRRIDGIINSKHAKGREQLARQIAFNTDMSVKDAEALLQAAPAAAKGALAAYMATQPNAEVGSGAAGGPSDEAANLAASIIAAGAKARGRQPKV